MKLAASYRIGSKHGHLAWLVSVLCINLHRILFSNRFGIMLKNLLKSVEPWQSKEDRG